MNAIKKAAIVVTMTASTLVAAGPAMAAPSTHVAAATATVSTSSVTPALPGCVLCW